MASHRPLAYLLLLMTLLAAGGAGCPQVVSNYVQPGPRALPPGATLADVMHVVNSNTAKIQTLSTDDATIDIPLAPALRTTMELERPRRFRLQGGTSFTGPQVDLGSNDELFWVWIRQLQPPATYVCRHDQFRYSALKQYVPVEPEFLIEALGLATLDPSASHQGPVPQRGGRLEVRTPLATPSGQLTKVTIVDEVTGWVVEQHLYDAQGQRLASATLSRHWRDPLSGAAVPKQIELSTAGSQFTLRLDVRTWKVNQRRSDPSQLFALPQYPGYNVVDLGDPNLQLTPAASPPIAQPYTHSWPAPQATRPTGGLRAAF